MTVEEVAAIIGLTASDAQVVVRELTRAGLLKALQSGQYALDDGALQDAADQGVEFDAQEVRRRFAQHVLDAVTLTLSGTAEMWVVDHPANLLGAVRVAAEHGLFELAARLAAAVWELAPDVSDQQWWHDLAHWGEEAAIGWQNPAFLAELHCRSARFFQHTRQFQAAESRWARALRIGRRLPDHALIVTVLESLSELYGDWGRIHRKLDVLMALLLANQQSGSRRAVARTQFAIGCTMLAANRAESAVEHLSNADREFGALGVTEQVGQDRAEVLVHLGRAHWMLGASGRARRCFDRALALVVDRDDSRTRLIRKLLATAGGEPLPED